MDSYLVGLLGGISQEKMLIVIGIIFVLIIATSFVIRSVKLVIMLVIIAGLLSYGWNYASEKIEDMGVYYQNEVLSVGEHDYDMGDVVSIQSYKTLDGKSVKIKFSFNEYADEDVPTELVVDPIIYKALNAVTKGKLGDLKEEPLGL